MVDGYQDLKEKLKHLKRGHKFAAMGLPIVAIVTFIWFGTSLTYRLAHATTNDAFVKADLLDLSPFVTWPFIRNCC
jgi:multidrug resistance efflux pump